MREDRRGQIQPGHLGVVPTRARVVGRHDGHDDVVAVPIELPDAAIVRPHLGSLARCEVDEEQPASHVAGRAHDRVGVGLGAVDGPGAPIQAVGERIRGQDEQPLTVARTRRGSRPNPAAWPPAPAPRRRRASCTGSWCPGVIRSDRNASRVPSGDQTGSRSQQSPRVSRCGTASGSVASTYRSLGWNEPTSATVACNAKASRAPSGDRASSAGVRTSSRSSAVGTSEVARHPRILPPHRAPTFAGWPQ